MSDQEKHHPAKHFVLDTNVILHDPTCIQQFQEHNIVIPLAVIEEIDHFKRGSQVINLNAREFSRTLDALIGKAIFNGGVPLGGNKGKIKIVITKGVSEPIQHIFREDTTDHRVLSVVWDLSQQKRNREQIILVSKDVNLRMKAKALGLQAEDYTTDQVASLDHLSRGKALVDDFDDDLLRQFFSPPYEVPAVDIAKALACELLPNTYFIFRNAQRSVLAHLDPSMQTFQRIDKRAVYGILPRNAEQIFAVHALTRPEVPLVTITGKAGTGKTLLALASALEIRQHYRQIYLARPIVPLSNKDLGYLPGDIESKVAPYMKPLWDNLKVIQDQFSDKERDYVRINDMIKDKKLVIEPLSYIRGRSLQRIFMIVDEAQNLTPHEVKTIITRAGSGSKIVLTGDIYQIDHPYLDAQSNGLSYLIDHFKGQKLYGHVNLEKGERSELAELASNLL